MTGLPAVQVLLDDGTGTFPFDITSKTLIEDGVTFTRGRDDWEGGVTAAVLNLTLNNNDGRFSPGSTIIASPSPIKVDQKIRLRETPGGNLLGANQASFEGGISDWVANGTVLPTLSQSATHVDDGSQALLITWGTGGTSPRAETTATGLVVGQTYSVRVRVYVPTSSPNVQLVIPGAVVGTTSAVNNAYTSITATFAAIATTQLIQVLAATAPTAGQQCWVDAVQFNNGPTALPFSPGGQTYTRFTGYVKSWPVSWPAVIGTISQVRITATDAQARAERRVLRSVVEEEILADSPVGLFTLGEPAVAVSAGDTSGAQQPNLVPIGTGTAVAFGTATGPTTDGLTAAQFANGQYLHSVLTFSSTPTAVSVGVFFATTATAQPILRFNQGGGFPTTLGIDGSGRVVITNGVVTVQSGLGFTDGRIHHALVTFTATDATLYLDGALIGTSASLGLGAALAASMDLAIGGMDTTFGGLGPIPVLTSFTGSLAHAAVFTTTPSAARILAESNAGLTGFAGESGTARITRLAGYANLPLGTLDASLTNVPFVDITDRSAWECIQEVAAAEGGAVFIDGSGNLTFHNRNRVVSKTTPDLTVVASSYLTADVEPVQDDQQIINYLGAIAAGTGVEQVVRNTASETTHGRYDLGGQTYLVQTDPEALDRANWIVANFAEPTTRFGTLTFNLYAMPTSIAQQVIAAVEIDAWARVISNPSQMPGSTTVDVVVEGYAETTNGGMWQLTCNVVSQSLFTPVWILGDSTYSVLGTTTRLYV